MATQIVITEDLLTEILLRVPAKPLIRLKCVCRMWKSIVTSKRFAQAHTVLHPPNSEPISGIFLFEATFRSNFRYHLLSLPIGPLSPIQMQLPAPIIRHSCYGLLLLHMRLSNSYSVYNPATRQFKELPPLNCKSLGVVLAFDPSRFEGFKAISVVRLAKSPSRALEIFSYSSHESCWNEWNGNPFYDDSDSVNFSNGVYWNGAVHWVSVSEDSFYFDIENEKLSNFSLPPISNDDVVYEQLCEFNGELHYMQGDNLFLSCKVYALLGYEQGWVLRYNVNGYDILRVVDLVFSQPYLVIYEERKQMLIHCGTKVMAYDLETNTWRTLCVDVCESGYSSNWSKGFYYTATLALF